MKPRDYYKVGFVKNARTWEESSFLWVHPIREFSSNPEVKAVESFEEQITQILDDSFVQLLRDASSGGVSEKSEFCLGDMLCVRHRNTWVRGEIISEMSSQEDGGGNGQVFSIFLVDHGLAVKRSLEMCKPIPRAIIAPKVGKFYQEYFLAILNYSIFVGNAGKKIVSLPRTPF